MAGPPRELLRVSLDVYYLNLKEKQNIFNVKKIISVSKYFKKCISSSINYLNIRILLEIVSGDINTIKSLIHRGADISFLDYAIIHLSFLNSNNNILNYLVSLGNEINPKIINILSVHKKIGALKAHVNNKKISYSNFIEWQNYCIEHDDVESFKILWSVVKNNNIIDVYGYEEFQDYMIKHCVNNIINEDEPGDKIFKHIMKTPEMNQYIYEEPSYHGAHIIERLMNMDTSILMKHLDFSRFEKQELIAFATAHENKDRCPKCMSISANAAVILHHLFDTQKVLPYDKIIIAVIGTVDTKLMEKLINHGCKIQDILEVAVVKNKEFALNYLLPKVPADSYLNIVRKMIRRGTFESHRYAAWIEHIKLDKNIPEELINNNLQFLLRHLTDD